MSENSVVQESTPEADVTPEVQTEESVNEDSQPSTDESSESSPEETTEETVVEAVQQALSDEVADEPAPKAEVEKQNQSEPEASVPEQEPIQNTEAEQAKEQAEESAEPDLYTEPEGLQPKASQRFQDLVADNKAKDQALGQAKEAVTQIQRSVQEAGISPDEFAVLLDYGKLATSTDRRMQEQALDFAKAEVRRLSQDIGVESDGVDLLDGFSDLQEQVDNFELSRDHAVELANSRRNQQRVQEHTEQTKQQYQTQQRQADVTQQSAQQIQSFMENQKKTDIDFNAKEKYLLSQVENIQKNYPPDQWPVIVEQLYSAVGSMASSQTQQVKKTAQSPLSPSGTTSGSAKAGSMADAIMAELGG